MKRRDFLTSLSAFLGCSVASIDLLALDSALAFSGQPSSAMSDIELRFITRLADIIVPETDTPSASQAGVPSYINFYLQEFLGDADRAKFLRDMGEMVASLQEFINQSEEEQVAVVQGLDDRVNTSDENLAYKNIKQLVVIGYFTSQIGATKVLKYDPVPGPYKEMKLADVGGVWF